MGLAAVFAALAGWATSWQVARRLGDGLPGSAASLVAGGAVLLVLYLLLGRAMRVRELADLTDLVRSRVGR